MTPNLLRQIRDDGVSPWLDGATRDQVRTGMLKALVEEFGVSGVTTDPTVFAKCLCSGSATYDDGLRDLAALGVDADEAARLLAAQDAREMCDVLGRVHEVSGGSDGWVSVDIDPRFANDVGATLADVRAIAWLVDRPNLMVKIPATLAGMSAIAAATAEGYNIDATLIFSVVRYRDVLDAYALGLERAQEGGIDISTIHSVASMSTSRVDTALVTRFPASLASIDAREALPGLANARNAYRVFCEATAASGWRSLIAAGANRQRLLWASTRVRNPALDPTTYIAGLALPNTVSAMPLTTLDAAARSCIPSLGCGLPTVEAVHEKRAVMTLDQVEDELMPQLLAEGVARSQKARQIVAAIIDQRLADERVTVPSVSR